MNEERLLGLAMLYTHRDKPFKGLEEGILKRFDSSGYRQIAKLSL